MTFEFRYAEQFLVALVLTSFTVIIHAAGMNWVFRYYRCSRSHAKEHKLSRAYGIVMSGIIAIMVGTHSERRNP
jgi:uncharacterized membrane protein YidH (DUF202 family)